jgi:hypothetical protein
MINNLFEQVKNRPKQEEPKEVHINLINSFTLSVETFLKKFDEINNMSDNELFDLVKSTYAMILESTVGKRDSILAVTLFNNARYIVALTNVLNTVKLTYSQKIYCNRLVYDYLRIPGDKDATIMSLLQNLSAIVNNDIIPSLLGIGLPINLASYIARARYSSMDEYVTVKRVNYYLFHTSDTNIITEQRIIKIYEIFYSECMTKLFKAIMADNYPKDVLDKASDESNEIYSLIGLAVLTMVNTMPHNDILFILKSYYEDYINFPFETRFSMKLSDDYSRINNALEMLSHEGIYLP